MDHVLGDFNELSDVRSRMNMELFKFFTRKQRGSLLTGTIQHRFDYILYRHVIGINDKKQKSLFLRNIKHAYRENTRHEKLGNSLILLKIVSLIITSLKCPP